MHAGMTRIFSYQDDDWEAPGKLKPGSNIVCNNICCLPGDPDARTGSVDPRQLSHTPHAGGHDHDMLHLYATGSLQSHMSEGIITLRNSRNDWLVAWEAGYADDTEYEIDLAWKRYINPNFSTIAGWRFADGHDAENRPFAGLLYRLPYLIDSSLQIDGEGEIRLGLGKELQLTSRISAFAEVEYDTGSQWEWSVGAEYLLNKPFSLITQYHSEYGFGGGFTFRF